SSPFAGRECRAEDREALGNQERGCDALERAPDDEHAEAGGEGAANRRNAERQDATREYALAAQPIADRAADQNQRRQEQQIDLDDPLRADDRGVQLLLDDREHDGDDGPIEEREARAEDRGGEDPERRASALAVASGRGVGDRGLARRAAKRH